MAFEHIGVVSTYEEATEGTIPPDWRFITEGEVSQAANRGSDASYGRPQTNIDGYDIVGRFTFDPTGWTEVDEYIDPRFLAEVKPVLGEFYRRYGLTAPRGTRSRLLLDIDWEAGLVRVTKAHADG